MSKLGLLIVAFRARRWEQASTAFERAAAERPGSRHPELSLERIAHLADDPPPEDWDGVTEYHHK